MGSLYSHPAARNLYGIFNDSFPPILDGVTLAVQNYVYWLDRMGHTPCVVTPWNPEREDYPFSVMRYFSLPIRSRKPYRYGYPKLDPFIWRRLRDTDFRLLHSHCPFSSGRLAVYVKKHKNIPLVGTFHSKYRADLEHSFQYMPWCVPIIMNRILHFFNSCDEVWIPQAQVEETVREYGYKGKLTVVENGNDFASVVTGPLKDYKCDAKKRMGIDSNVLSLLFVGQHIWEKGIRTVLESVAMLKGKIEFHLHFIGTGYAVDGMRELVGRLGLEDNVTLHGVIKDRKTLSDYYAASDLFLFPSFYDNAPLVLREAAAMGTPSVLLDGSTASEVIRDGVNGFLVSPDSREFSKAVERIGKDRKMLMEVSVEARNTLVRSWEDVVGEVADRYEVILKNYRK